MTDENNLASADNWRQIWEKKGDQEIAGTGLEQLVIYAGFDTVSGRVREEDYRKYVETICSKVHLEQNHRTLEVGCGIGAFLHCLKPIPTDIVGIDYSRSIVSRAERLRSNPHIRFYQAEADDFAKLNLGRFDVIFSNSVFFYFPSLDYAARVCRLLAQSLQQSGRIAILDVNDAMKKEQFLQMRYSEAGEARYKEDYKGLEHAFYERDFFRETFRALDCADILIEDQSWSGSMNSPYRFNVFVRM
jgi:cyclopropane fatty-acyl-phospholipid synthase-like methyltransferase